MRLQAVKDNGVDNTAETAPRRRDAERERALGSEVLRHDGYADDEQRAGADAHAEALGEHELPVGFAERDHHQPEDDQEGTHTDEGVGVAAVEERAHEDCGAAEEEGLDAADPGDGEVGAVGEERGGVVGLEDAVGVYEAPVVVRVSKLDAVLVDLVERTRS